MGALPCPLFSEGAKKAAVDTQGLASTDFLWRRERNLEAGGEWLRLFRDSGVTRLHKDSGKHQPD